MEKPDFEFVFALGTMLSAGEMGSFGAATLDAIRDDPRLQDPLALGGVLQALVFAPGACDAILEAARNIESRRLGAEGCDEATKAALIGFAHVAGPSGVAASERRAGAAELTAIAGSLSPQGDGSAARASRLGPAAARRQQRRGEHRPCGGRCAAPARPDRRA